MRNRHFKRLTSLLLVVVMLASMLPALPITVNAAETPTKTFTFSNYTAGSQYAKDEVHKLDDNFTMVTTESHFTSELRIYSSSTHNGYAILKCTNGNGTITGLAMNAGNKADTLVVHGSNDDGANWTQIGEVSVTSTSYKDYSITFPTDYKWIKLDVKGSNQVRLKSITVSYEISEPETPDCTHTDLTLINGTPAECTTEGVNTHYQCNSCDALLDENKNPTTENELKIPATGHTYVDGACSVCGAPEPQVPAFGIVTDISHLNVGDHVVIVAKDYNFAMSTTQNNNNRGQADFDKIDSGIESDSPVQIFTVETGKSNGTFAFNTGAGYIYAASSDGNYLRTEITLSANSSWKITIADDGTATIVAQGSNTRNTLQYNQSSSLFSCYAPDKPQKAISIYKICSHKNTEDIGEEKKPTCTEPGLTAGEKCSDCGIVITAQEEIRANGHTEVDIPADEATCQQEGSKNGKECSVCGEQTQAPESIPKTEHPNANGDNVCDVCGDPICNHVFDNGKITQVPTCKQNGEITYTCTQENCDYSRTEELEIDPDNHTEEDIPGKAATCTEDGLTDGKKCSECAVVTIAQETIPAINHENAYAVSRKDPTCTEPGLTAGEYCPDCETYPTPQEEIPATGHNYTEGACSSCGKAKPLPSGYFLVTDVSTLKAGDKIVIVAKDYNFALSTEQKSNNRGQIEITKNDNSITINENVQIITLEEGTVDDTFAFYTGSGYLYAASNKENYLRTQTTNNANGSWKIEISDDGTATIKAQGENGRNWLRYNQTSSLFSCYGSGQGDVVIYKLEEAPKLSGYSVTLNKGVTVNLTYNVPNSWIAANEGAYVTFNGEKTELVAGANKFTTTLTPKKVNEDLFLTLYTSDGTVVTKYNVGVATYKSTIESLTASQLGMSDAKYTALTALLNKVVVYGKAATDDLENNLDVETFDGVDDWNGANDTYDVFNEISAELSEQADMYITINKENVDLDYTITITRGTTTLASGSINTFITKDGYIVIAGLFPADFNKEITITVSNESDEVIAQASFTFNEYLKALYNSISDTYFKNMIAATYQYGVAVDTYVKA